MRDERKNIDDEASGTQSAPQPGHPSQAEGEDPDHPSTHTDPPEQGHPSQAEGEDDGRSE
jgi:hypothetical protein